MPFPSDDWAAVVQPFWQEGPVWEFWKEANVGLVRETIEHMLSAGVTCIAQEYGPYDARLWTQFVRAVCIRHPIDRLYSDFLHRRDLRQVPAGISFADWVECGSGLPSTSLYMEQLGRGNLAQALETLDGFHVIVVQEHYRETLAKMQAYGWTSTDPEVHFTSWTVRRTQTGRQVLAEHPKILRTLEQRCAADIQIYNRAVDLALLRAETDAPSIPTGPAKSRPSARRHSRAR
jgi:hypothetical protein